MQPVSMQANPATTDAQSPPLIFTVALSGRPALNAQIPVRRLVGFDPATGLKSKCDFFFFCPL